MCLDNSLGHLVGETPSVRDSQLIFGAGSIEWETVGWPLCPLGGMGLTRYVALLFDPDNLEGVTLDVTRENTLSIFPENPVHLTKVRALCTER